MPTAPDVRLPVGFNTYRPERRAHPLGCNPIATQPVENSLLRVGTDPGESPYDCLLSATRWYSLGRALLG